MCVPYAQPRLMRFRSTDSHYKYCINNGRDVNETFVCLNEKWECNTVRLQRMDFRHVCANLLSHRRD